MNLTIGGTLHLLARLGLEPHHRDARHSRPQPGQMLLVHRVARHTYRARSPEHPCHTWPTPGPLTPMLPQAPWHPAKTVGYPRPALGFSRQPGQNRSGCYNAPRCWTRLPLQAHRSRCSLRPTAVANRPTTLRIGADAHGFTSATVQQVMELTEQQS